MRTQKISWARLAVVSFGHMAIDMQTSSLAVLVPLLYVALKLDYATAALIVTVHNLAAALLQPVIGSLGDPLRLCWLLPAGCLVTALAMVTIVFVPTYLLVLAAAVISGLGAAAYHPEGSLTANEVSGAHQAAGFSVFFFGGNLSAALGPLAAAALGHTWSMSGEISMLIPGLLGSLALWYMGSRLTRSSRHNSPAPAARHSIQPAPPYSSQRQLLLLVLILALLSIRTVIQMGMLTFLPLAYLAMSGHAKEDAAFLLYVFIVAQALGNLIGGPLTDHWDRRLVLAGSFLLVTALLLLVMVSSGIVQIIALGLAGALLTPAIILPVVMAQELLPTRLGLVSEVTIGKPMGAGGIGVALLGKYADLVGLNQTLFLLALLPLLIVALSLGLPPRPVSQAPITEPDGMIVPPDVALGVVAHGRE